MSKLKKHPESRGTKSVRDYVKWINSDTGQLQWAKVESFMIRFQLGEHTARLEGDIFMIPECFPEGEHNPYKPETHSETVKAEYRKFLKEVDHLIETEDIPGILGYQTKSLAARSKKTQEYAQRFKLPDNWRIVKKGEAVNQ